MNKEPINFCPEEQVDEEALKALKTQINAGSSRNQNVGNNNYANMPAGYQPWDLWKVYHMNPWDADILKRLLRNKVEPGMTI